VARVLRKSRIACYAIQEDQQGIVYFEDHTEAAGTRHLDDIYQAIREKTCLIITSKPFTAEEAERFSFSPYFLKEYRNRWYVIGYHHTLKKVVSPGLDRLHRCRELSGDVYLAMP